MDFSSDSDSDPYQPLGISYINGIEKLRWDEITRSMHYPS